MNEEWKPVNVRGLRIPKYYISDQGRILSRCQKKEKVLKVLKRDYQNGRGNSTQINISIPKGMYLDEYHGQVQKSKSIKQQVHQLVMWAFRPIDTHPPDVLKEEWNQIITPEMVGQPRIPESYKIWVKDTVIIDHINDDPFDNRLENLRYTTQKENNVYRKKKKNND